MADYVSAYTGSQIDEAVDKALGLPAAVAELDENGKILIDQELLETAYHTVSYPLAAGDDAHKLHASSDAHINVTIPPDVFQVGVMIPFYVLTGSITMVAGAGVTLESINGLVKATGRAFPAIVQRALNYWVLLGFNS